MLLTLSTTHRPATDLGFLLHKNPARAHAFDVATGTAHVFYPEADEDSCTAALLLEVDPVAFVRGHKGPAGEGFSLGQYVNDRPYSASSLLAVAMGKVFSSAMKGRCAERPDLVDEALPLRIRLPVLPCSGGPDVAARMFEPLGWSVTARPIPLDETVPAWGDSRYVDLTLDGTVVLADALRQLYVLLPVLDDAKHYWVSNDEVEKLVRAGEGWLSQHPEREQITRRYLAHRTPYTRAALARLAAADDIEEDTVDDALAGPVVAPPTLAEERQKAVVAALNDVGAHRVLDLGCGQGALLRQLLEQPAFTEIVGADVSDRALSTAARRLRLDQLAPMQAARIRLVQSSLTYTDDRLVGYDAAVLMEVIEHLDSFRLDALERSVFSHLDAASVIVTTPNVEYNPLYEGLAAGERRHRDHRFEWTRAEFAEWAEGVASRHNYGVTYQPVGKEHPTLGAPTQMAVFRRGVTA